MRRHTSVKTKFTSSTPS